LLAHSHPSLKNSTLLGPVFKPAYSNYRSRQKGLQMSGLAIGRLDLKGLWQLELQLCSLIRFLPRRQEARSLFRESDPFFFVSWVQPH